MSEHETQESVTSWIEESYPGASLKRRLKHLFEEVTEGVVSAGTELTLEEALNVVTHAWTKAQGQPQDPKKEIGDIRISLIGIASHLEIDEQEALDTVMQENRARSLEERQAREAAKLELNIFNT